MSNLLDLRIHNLTLAQEARIYKRLAKSRRQTKEQRKELHATYVNTIRPEARASHLAYGFLRGRTYEEMELPLRPTELGHLSSLNMTKSEPDWDLVYEFASENCDYDKWTEQEFNQRFEEFVQTARTPTEYSVTADFRITPKAYAL